MTRNIYLNGEIGQLFGNKWRLNCKTIQEAMHAIDCMKGGMRRYLTDCTENGVGFTVQKGEDFLDNQTVGIELGKDDLIITPVPAGSRRQKSKGQSFVKIIVAVLMIYIGFNLVTIGSDQRFMSAGAKNSIEKIKGIKKESEIKGY